MHTQIEIELERGVGSNCDDCSFPVWTHRNFQFPQAIVIVWTRTGEQLTLCRTQGRKDEQGRGVSAEHGLGCVQWVENVPGPAVDFPDCLWE